MFKENVFSITSTVKWWADVKSCETFLNSSHELHFEFESVSISSQVHSLAELQKFGLFSITQMEFAVSWPTCCPCKFRICHMPCFLNSGISLFLSPSLWFNFNFICLYFNFHGINMFSGSEYYKLTYIKCSKT